MAITNKIQTEEKEEEKKKRRTTTKKNKKFTWNYPRICRTRIFRCWSAILSLILPLPRAPIALPNFFVTPTGPTRSQASR